MPLHSDNVKYFIQSEYREDVTKSQKGRAQGSPLQYKNL